MRPRRCRTTAVAAVVVGLFSTFPATTTARFAGAADGVPGRKTLNAPCTIPAAESGDVEIAGWWVPDPICAMQRSEEERRYGLRPDDCLECAPLPRGFDRRGEGGGGGIDRHQNDHHRQQQHKRRPRPSGLSSQGLGAEQEDLFREQALSEEEAEWSLTRGEADPDTDRLPLENRLAVVPAAARAERGVAPDGVERGGLEGEGEESGGDGVAAGVIAAVAAAAAAALASAVSEAADEIPSLLSSSSSSADGEAVAKAGAEAGIASFGSSSPDPDPRWAAKEEGGMEKELRVSGRFEGEAEDVGSSGLRGGRGRPRGGAGSWVASGGLDEAEREGLAGGAEVDKGAGVGTGHGVHRRRLQVDTPAPVAIDTTPAPAPVVEATPAPVGDVTPAPVVAPTPAPVVAPTPAPGATPAPSATETAQPVLTPSPASFTATLIPSIIESFAPSSTTDAPGASPSPTLSPLMDSETRAPGTVFPTPSSTNGTTLSPLAPGETRAPTLTPTASPASNDTLAPGASPSGDNSTLAPDGTASPTQLPTFAEEVNTTQTEETLDTTGEVASTAVTVGVAATAAAATVTTVTATTAATTAVTTTAATSTVTSTVTTAATTAASGGSAGGATGTGAGAASGASGATATSTTAASGTQGAATTTATTSATTTNAGSLPDASNFRGNVQNNIQSNTTSGGTSNATTTNVATSDPGSISARSPSATLGLLMIFQMQFVSLLRMLEANITEPFMDFMDSLKWLNLHFEVDISFFNCSDEETRFDWSNDDNGTWALNTFLVFALLALLILLHILLLSYLEASWLARANAIHRHRLQLLQKRTAQEVAAPIDGGNARAYAKYLDAKNQDRELYEQEKLSAERFLRRHNSVWMYFPHVELLFLLFAYQGASAAEARLIYSGCVPLVVLGICALFIFPMMMFVYVNRIVWNRLRPATSPVVFTPSQDAKSGCFLFQACGGICSAWRHGHSMFAWADKGTWISKNDEDIDLDSRKFRIGFEPLFVDYTQRGTLYVTFLLFEWFAFGLIAGFVTDGRIQTAAIFLIYVVDFLILVCLRPFSNSIIQCITTMTVLADALTVGVMCYASFLDPDDSDDEDRLKLLYAGALMIQTLTIIFFVVPLYLDAFVTVLGTICAKTMGLFKRKPDKVKAPIKGSLGETWWIFGALVRENFIGCVKSTWKGPTYRPMNTADQQRRRDSLLEPVNESSEEEGDTTFNSGFGVLPRQVRSTKGPSARHPRHISTSLALEDFSGHDPSQRSIGSAGVSSRSNGSHRPSKSSVSGAHRPSRSSSTYSRDSASGRR